MERVQPKQLKGSKKFEKLPVAAQAYIIYKPLNKIKNKDVKKYADEFLSSASNNNYDIVGSYRRQTPFSRDIDILWYEYEKPIDELLNPEDSDKGSDFHIYAKGPDKISGIFTAKNGTSVKIDLWLVSSPKFKAGMKLYATGSKMFNIRQRMKAKKLGYKLNQEGLHRVTSSGDKQIPTKTEKNIFDLLKMEYKEPKDRR